MEIPVGEPEVISGRLIWWCVSGEEVEIVVGFQQSLKHTVSDIRKHLLLTIRIEKILLVFKI